MERAQDGLEKAFGVTDAAAANDDDNVDGAGPAPAWDPYEVWRTRVKDVRDQRPSATGDSAEPKGPAGKRGRKRR
jgi:hypothetical protein